MKSRVFLLTALLGGLTCAAASAQEAPQQTRPAVNQPPKTTSAADAQAEDIEIMRRLLARALTTGQTRFTAGNFVFPPKVTNMGTAMVDFDADGRLDLFIAHDLIAPNRALGNTFADLITVVGGDSVLYTLDKSGAVIQSQQAHI